MSDMQRHLRATEQAVKAACDVITQLTLKDEALDALWDVPNPALQRLYQVLRQSARMKYVKKCIDAQDVMTR